MFHPSFVVLKASLGRQLFPFADAPSAADGDQTIAAKPSGQAHEGEGDGEADIEKHIAMEIAEESGLAADTVGFGKMGANRSVGIQVVSHLRGNDDIKRVVSERKLCGGPNDVSTGRIQGKGAWRDVVIGNMPLPALLLGEGFKAASKETVTGSDVEDGQSSTVFGPEFADESTFERPGKSGQPIHPTEPMVGVTDLGVGKLWGIQTFSLRCPFAKKHAANKSIHAFRTSSTAWKPSGKNTLVAACRGSHERLVSGLLGNSTIGTDGGCVGTAQRFSGWVVAWGVDALGITSVIDGARHDNLRTVEHWSRIQAGLHGWS